MATRNRIAGLILVLPTFALSACAHRSSSIYAGSRYDGQQSNEVLLGRGSFFEGFLECFEEHRGTRSLDRSRWVEEQGHLEYLGGDREY